MAEGNTRVVDDIGVKVSVDLSEFRRSMSQMRQELNNFNNNQQGNGTSGNTRANAQTTAALRVQLAELRRQTEELRAQQAMQRTNVAQANTQTAQARQQTAQINQQTQATRAQQQLALEAARQQTAIVREEQRRLTLQQRQSQALRYQHNILGTIGLSIRQLIGFEALKAGLSSVTNYLKQFGKEAHDAFNTASTSATSFNSILEKTGSDVNSANEYIKNYTQDSLVSQTAAQSSYKTLASAGYDDTQIQTILDSLKDAAAFNREGSKSMDDAITLATQGLKSGNSNNTDAAGITKNLSNMLNDYAKSIGTTAGKLTEEQIREAYTSQFASEGAMFSGDAAKAAESLGGQEQQLETSFTRLKEAVGGIIAPVEQYLLPIVNDLVQSLTEWASALAEILQELFGYDPSKSNFSAGASSETSDDNEAQEVVVTADESTDKEENALDELNILKTKDNEVVDAIEDAAKETTKAISDDNSKNNGLSDLAQSIRDKITSMKDRFQPLLDNISSIFDSVKNKLDDYFDSEAFQNMKDSLKNIADSLISILTKVTEIVNKIVGDDANDMRLGSNLASTSMSAVTFAVGSITGDEELKQNSSQAMANSISDLRKTMTERWVKEEANKSIESGNFDYSNLSNKQISKVEDAINALTAEEIAKINEQSKTAEGTNQLVEDILTYLGSKGLTTLDNVNNTQLVNAFLDKVGVDNKSYKNDISSIKNGVVNYVVENNITGLENMDRVDDLSAVKTKLKSALKDSGYTSSQIKDILKDLGISSFANGGVVFPGAASGIGSLVRVAENEPEAIVPLSNLNTMFSDLQYLRSINSYASALSSEQSNILSYMRSGFMEVCSILNAIYAKDNTVYISEQQIGTAAIGYINSETRRSGNSPLLK